MNSPSPGGRVEAIFTAPTRAAPLEPRDGAHAVPGKGLVGDRHFDPASGNPPRQAKAGREITLIEAEAIEAARREHQVDLGNGRNRRNLVTRGVRLLELLGKRFRVGAVELRGEMECHPCAHLGKLTGTNAVQALAGRGGLCCTILNEGEIHVGDPIVAGEP